MKTASRIYTGLIFLFLYAPILVIIIFSFNSVDSTSVMEGFSLKWYKELFKDTETLKAFKNTLVLALSSSLTATAIGTVAAVGIYNMKNKYIKGAVMTTTNMPMMNPDIVTGISLMLLFVTVGVFLNINGVLGFWTMLIAHVTFNLPYVILSVLPKLRQMDKHLPEAAMDLGCTPIQSFFKVELPTILPGVFTGMIMAFTLSLDDFVISYFTSGPEFQTLPIRIFAMTKKRFHPDMYSLSTLIFLSILILLILINVMGARNERKNNFSVKEPEN